MKQIAFSIFILFTLILLGCEEKTEYQKLLDKELSKNVRQDSLFLDYYFGMTKKEFFSYSWALNKQKKIKQGGGNQSVQYELTGLPHKAYLNYYPKFKDDKIFKMEASVRYIAWAPWNKEMFADSLKYDLVELFEKKYGKGFIEVKDPKNGTTFIKIDGNREISLFAENDQKVAVNFTDLTITEEDNEE